MSCDDGIFPLGSLVVVTRGKHAGSLFAVIGMEENAGKNGKILIADGAKISAAKPKRKNARHVQRTEFVLDEAVQGLARGKKPDDGWLQERLRSYREKIQSQLS